MFAVCRQVTVSSRLALASADQASEWEKYREWNRREEFRVVRGRNLMRRALRRHLHLYRGVYT